MSLRIFLLRKRLNRLAKPDRPLNYDKLYDVSVRLDKLINQYYQIHPAVHRQIKSVEDASVIFREKEKIKQ